jgi:hypothetical protein
VKKFMLEIFMSGSSFIITEISLYRKPGYSKLPEYRVILRNDGQFIYKGCYNVKIQGEHSGSVGVQSFNGLARFIAESGYFDMENIYSSILTDQPEDIISVKFLDAADKQGNEFVKEVRNYGYVGPEALRWIVEMIEQLLSRAGCNE